MPHTNLRAVGYSGFLNVRKLIGNFRARHCQNLQFLSGRPKGLVNERALVDTNVRRAAPYYLVEGFGAALKMHSGVTFSSPTSG